MLLFFFLLLMLAVAWGVADHYQSFIHKSPPPEPASIQIEAPAHQPPPILPPVSAPQKNNDLVDATSADSAVPASTGKTDTIDSSNENP